MLLRAGRFANVILVGDLNCDLLNPDSGAKDGGALIDFGRSLSIIQSNKWTYKSHKHFYYSDWRYIYIKTTIISIFWSLWYWNQWSLFSLCCDEISLS